MRKSYIIQSLVYGMAYIPFGVLGYKGGEKLCHIVKCKYYGLDHKNTKMR